MPLGGRAGVEANSEVRWLLFVDQLHQCVGETELGIGVLAGGADAGTTNQCIVGAKDQCKGIEKKDPFIHASNVQTGGAMRDYFFRDSRRFWRANRSSRNLAASMKSRSLAAFSICFFSQRACFSKSAVVIESTAPS